MKNITIILPIHKMDDDYKEMLDNALDSIKPFHNDVKVAIVTPSSLKLDLGEYLNILEINHLKHNNSSSFTSQVNYGIEKCDTEWFSILEIDDTYNKFWLKTMLKFKEETPDVDIFLPIVKDINTEGNFVGYTNESVWAYGFSDKIGFLDHEILLEFQNYQTSGGLYKTEMIKEMGSFKDNIELTFSYEFLLRLTNNGVKVVIVPKVLYNHLNLREDSLFWLYKNDETALLSKEKVSFWLETAKKEFLYKNKREINVV